MKAISQFVVHVFDLIEAEGSTFLSIARGEARRAQSTAASMAMAGAILLIAVPLLVGGVSLLAAGLMWWLETRMDRPFAAGLTGLVIVLLGLGCLFWSKWLATGGRS